MQRVPQWWVFEKRVLTERSGQRIECIAKLVLRDRLRAPVVGKFLQGFACEVQAVFDAGK